MLNRRGIENVERWRGDPGQIGILGRSEKGKAASRRDETEGSRAQRALVALRFSFSGKGGRRMAGGVGAKGDEGPARRLPRSPRPDLCRRYARKELARGLPGILQRFIDEAQKGSIPHAKALMSLAGLDRDEPVKAAHGKRAKGFSEMLLRELRRKPGRDTSENGMRQGEQQIENPREGTT